MPQAAPGAPGGAFAGGTGGPGAASQPVQILQTIAQQIKAANPGIDDETLMDAVEGQVALMKGVQPEIKDQLNAMMAEARVQIAQQGIELKAQWLAQQLQEFNRRQADTEELNRARESLLDLKSQMQDLKNQGKDPGKQQDLENKLAVLQKQFDNQMALAEFKESGKLPPDVVEQYRALVKEGTALISSGSAPGSPERKANEAQRQALVDKMTRIAEANGKKREDIIKQFSDIANDRAAPTKPAAPAKTSSAPSTGNKTSALPSDLPDPKGMADGTQAKDGSGKVVAVIKDGQWSEP